MNRTPLAAASILALAAPRAAFAGDIGSTLVSIGVPAIVFGFVLAIVGGAFYVGYRETRERQETLRLAIEKGIAIPPGLVESVSGERDPDRDLRNGVRQIFIGLGVGVLLWFVSPFRNVWAVGAMIAIFGLGNIVAWAMTRRPAKPSAPSP
ncbi:MAG: DUF6249 domain-containing protein [Deltaproteobacteria bacterium]